MLMGRDLIVSRSKGGQGGGSPAPAIPTWAATLVAAMFESTCRKLSMGELSLSLALLRDRHPHADAALSSTLQPP